MIKKNVAICVILTIITCGLYSLYWVATLQDSITIITEDNDSPKGSTVVLLSIITCGIYGLYWSYMSGKRIDNKRIEKGYSSSELGILYLLLSLFGLSIVTLALMQNEINKFEVA